MNVVAIIQARMSSTRLPQKVALELLPNISVLEYLIKRVQLSQKVNNIVVATSNESNDDQIERICIKANVNCFRGSLNDVLDRYYQCAKIHAKPDSMIARITGDCPLIDPNVIDETIKLAITKDVDFCHNTTPVTLPDGMDVAVMKFSALEIAWKEAKEQSDREHVTSYIIRHSQLRSKDQFSASSYSIDYDLSHIRLTLDELADYEVIKHIALNCPLKSTYNDYLSFLSKEVWPLAHNAKIERNEGSRPNPPLIKIERDEISKKNPVYIIAEIGANHNNDINNAFKLIDSCVLAKANAVKFQSYNADTLYSKHTPRKIDNKGNFVGPNFYDLIKQIQMPYEWHKPLKEYCDKKGITFLSSPFDYEAVDSLEEIGVSVYKVASSEIGDRDFLKYIARKKKPIIMSTGKATLKEVEKSVQWIIDEGNKQIILLHCTASYPAHYDAMNLRAIKTLQKKFNLLVGLSDHNQENLTACLAVALGAQVIEKHITLDKDMDGPDHHFALTPDQFEDLVDKIRKTEKALGNGVKIPNSSEKQGRILGNRSIHVNKTLMVGHILQKNDLIVKRPALGIVPDRLEEVIGKKVIKIIAEDMWLTWDDVEPCS